MSSRQRSWEDKVVIEGAQQKLVPFLTNSWLDSNWDWKEQQHTTHKDVYYPGEHDLISYLLQHSHVLVARDAEATDFFYGWICYDWDVSAAGIRRLVVHYIYVKHSFRRRGIARALLDAAGWIPGEHPLRCTHWGRVPALAAPKFQAFLDEYYIFRHMRRTYANQGSLPTVA